MCDKPNDCRSSQASKETATRTATGARLSLHKQTASCDEVGIAKINPWG